MMCSSQMGKGGKARGTKAPSQLKEWEHWDKRRAPSLASSRSAPNSAPSRGNINDLEDLFESNAAWARANHQLVADIENGKVKPEDFKPLPGRVVQ